MQTQLRPACAADAPALATLYNHYVCHSIATFEEQPVDAGELAARLSRVQDAALPWWVATCTPSGSLLGYAYAAPWKPRSAYCHTVEVSVYLADGATGQGLGKQLASRLLESLAERDIHAVLAGIALPNPASVAMHEALGFEKVGQLREVGCKFGRWLDVGYWQRVI